MVDAEWLKSIIEDDDDGLLRLPVRAPATTSHDRLIAAFHEICAFIERNGRPPEANMTDMAEFKLHHRLRAILSDPDQRADLRQYDIYGLLFEPEPPATLDAIFESDDLGILND